jgi:3-oxoacyl-[acyl-carrier protein] reductase
VSKSDGPATLISATRSHFASKTSGDLTISIIVNNAGVAGNRYLIPSIQSSTADSDIIGDFEFQYKTNVLGPLLLIQAAMPYLPTDRSGRIVNISSVSSSCGFPGQSIYGGTKAAVEAMTRTWSRELSERCTVNAVNPGPVDTDMYAGVSKDFSEMMVSWNSITPGAQLREGKGGDDEKLIKFVKDGNEGRGLGGRAASVQEIAGVVGMLCSAESAWCTGSVICANGGMRFSM